MVTFDFPYYILSDEYPESSKTVSFGGGYTFASAPRGPDQLIFNLDFQALFHWYTTAGVVSRTIQPSLNAFRLQDFYEVHRQYEPFTFVHPTRGSQTVRFHKPLPKFIPTKEQVIVDKVTGARGHQIAPITIQLIQKL